MSEHDPTPEIPVVDGAPPDDEPAARARREAQARNRPPDPAGTRPEWDPDDLLPKRRAWLRPAPVGPDGDGDRELIGAAAGRGGGDNGARPAAAGGAAPPPDAPHESRYAPRFQFALGALLAIGAAAVALASLIAIGGGNKAHEIVGPTWSPWLPSPDAGDGPTQIANHVGPEYRLPDGKQLVAVTGGPMQIAGLPLTVALREPVSAGGNIKLIDGKGVLYRLCGLGPKCSIDDGKASQSRHLLLRREALELALYSFRYLDGVQEAVVFLPPRKGQDPSQALFFQKRDLEGSVDRPLSATLVPKTPTVQSVTSSPDASLVNTITTKTLFQFSLTQANQDARAFLVLKPLAGG